MQRTGVALAPGALLQQGVPDEESQTAERPVKAMFGLAASPPSQAGMEPVAGCRQGQQEQGVQDPDVVDVPEDFARGPGRIHASRPASWSRSGPITLR